ncbi:hypothetical protein DFH28DRAFT_1222297 [Melampsora americana]|nr:hypothetical protein DFH28DRAFT_1222297 [Melampsora americana]
MPSNSELPSESVQSIISSSNFDVNDPSTQLTPGQLQIDPSTLTQVLAGAIQLAQSTVSPLITTASKPTNAITCNKAKATVLIAKAQSSKPTDTKKSSTKKTSSKKTLTKKNPTKKNPTKKNQPERNQKNHNQFKDKGSYNREVAEEVERYLVKNRIVWQDASAIQKKVEPLEAAWHQANDICKGTGGGAFDAAFALNEQQKWTDESPKAHLEEVQVLL